MWFRRKCQYALWIESLRWWSIQSYETWGVPCHLSSGIESSKSCTLAFEKYIQSLRFVMLLFFYYSVGVFKSTYNYKFFTYFLCDTQTLGRIMVKGIKCITHIKFPSNFNGTKRVYLSTLCSTGIQGFWIAYPHSDCREAIETLWRFQ